MRKLFIVMGLAAGAAFGLAAAPAQAQDYPSVSDVTQFTQSANYMSLPGYLRYAYFLQSGRWISREEAENAVRDQIGSVPDAPAGDAGTVEEGDGMDAGDGTMEEGDGTMDEGDGTMEEGDGTMEEDATEEAPM